MAADLRSGCVVAVQCREWFNLGMVVVYVSGTLQVPLCYSSRSLSVETPPQLPAKNRPTLSRSQAMATSSIDSLDGPSSWSSALSDRALASRPRSALIAGHLTRRDNYDSFVSYARSNRSGASSSQLFSSQDSINAGKRCSVISNSSQSSTGYDWSRDYSLALHQRAAVGSSEGDLSPIQPIREAGLSHHISNSRCRFTLTTHSFRLFFFLQQLLIAEL